MFRSSKKVMWNQKGVAMSQLLVLTFNDTVQASEALEALKKMQHAGQVKIDDAAVIVKDESGKVEIKNQLDTGVKVGAVGGGLAGLLIAGLFFPLAGLAIGAVAGGLIGKMADVNTVRAALEPFHGTIYQTTLPSEAVEVLRSALE
jgi:uncharacterized membrane protein